MSWKELLMSDVKYVELHGDRVAYREAGSGEVIVLIHGMAGSSETWEAVLRRLARNYRVIAPDLLGHGHSDKPRTDYSLAAFAAGLRDLFDGLGIRRATIVGHSLGGGVAMQLMYQHPECCQRLILISSGGLGPDVGWILRLLTAPGAEFVLPLIAPKIVPGLGNRIGSWLSAAGLHSPRAGQMWRGYCSLSDPPTRVAFLRTLRSVVDYRGQSVSALSRLRLRSEVPTLVVWGERDQIIPVEHGYAVREARPGSRLDVLPGVGHFPHVEAPNEVVTAIEAFIADSYDATQHLPHPNSHTRSPRSQDTACVAGGLRGTITDLETRREIEVAIGVLMGLRGCSHREAVNEYLDAVHETGTRAPELGRALVDLANGDESSSPHRTEAQRRWGHLVTLRGLGGTTNDGTVTDTVRVRYGPDNTTTIC
jgi:pimeloyl-ACP methyl ester carboxylesterase